MKKFEEPKLNVAVLDLEDVITTSTCTADGIPSNPACPYETECIGD